VAPRIGLISETKRRIKAEKQLMQVLPKEIMGRRCYFIFGKRNMYSPQTQMSECPINSICEYYKNKKG
jgi:endonuclease-3